MKLSLKICVGLLLLHAVCLWCQVDNTARQPAMPNNEENPTNNPDQSASRMLTPPPVSGQEYPASFSAGEKSNYLRGGVAFSSAYSDNALGSVAGKAISDVSYSVAPFIVLDETTSRLHWALSYAPGFTFYQRTSSRSEADHNAAIDFQYRLSPHLTFTARDGFQKSSSVFNQPFLPGVPAVAGGTQEPNFSVIAPVSPFLSNFGNLGISYQFALNGMLGANGTFSNLHYENQAQTPGLSDSNGQGGSAFYTFRISKMHYIGATYQYQRFVSDLALGQTETQTHALLLFYTLYATPRLSISFFGGPQHSDTVQLPQPAFPLQLTTTRAWTPAAGASMSWQGRLTNVAVSYAHVISDGGGLIGAVQMDSANGSMRQQLTRRLSGSVGAMYAQNNVLGSALRGATNGHSVAGTASLQQEIGQHINVQLGYTRLHQNYSGVAVLAATPNTNREYISISYQFFRPLGR
jgi:hypothetical protein